LPFESATAAVQTLIAASGSEAAQGGLPTLNFAKVGFYLALLVGCALFAAVAGLVSSWIDRKVTALVQARVGPRFSQPLWDLLKLLGKETVIPAGANRLTFVLMPLVALAAVALAATILVANVLWQNGLLPSYGGLSHYGMVGDLIVVLYLLAVPSLALVVGASSSNNPFASVGASREMKLMCYELPLLLAVAAALVLAATTERRFTDELQKQVDRSAAGMSPLSSADAKLAKLSTVRSALQRREAELLDAAIEKRPAKLLPLKREVADYQRQIETLLRAPSAPDRTWQLGQCQTALAGAQSRLRDALAKEYPGDALKREFPLEGGALEDLRRLEADWRADVEGAGKGQALGAVVPLRFDHLLALRLASAEPADRLMAERGQARVRAEVAGRLAAVQDALRSRPNGRWPQLQRDEALLKLEQARMRLDSMEQGLSRQKTGAAGSGGPRAEVPRPQLDRYEQAVKAQREEVDRLWREAVDLRAASREEGPPKGALAVDSAALVRETVPAGPARMLELFALGLCVAVALMCAQAKLGLVPFDCAEAETEIAGGVFIEYGGPLLGAWKLSRQMLLFVMPVFIGMVFLGGFRFFVPEGSGPETLGQAVVSALKYVGVLVVFILVRNTNPRVRIDQAMRFFLGPMTALAVLALIVAMAARYLLLGGVV
jgi:formate hydrogenlyase subunit 4